MPSMIFIDKDGRRMRCDYSEGETVLDVARRYSLDLEGACEGQMACSTCHIIVDKEWMMKLPKPKAEENEMLDLASGVTRTSRLGCQILLTNALDGLMVSLP